MVQPRVVFVVGAGASVPFGLRTGRQLRDHIIENAGRYAKEIEGNNRYSSDKMADYAFHDGMDFAKLLRESGSQSIDQFLRSQPARSDLGKLLITKSLLADELSAIQDAPNSWDWLGVLFQKTYGETPSPESPPFGVVTFNYDRLVASALIRMAMSAFGCQLHDAKNRVSGVPIHHVYGNFGAVPLDRIRDGIDIAKLAENSAAIFEAARGIRVIPEDRSGEAEADKTTCDLIQRAETLVFLGFGFDRQNLATLGIELDTAAEHLQSSRVFTTTVGLGPGPSERIAATFPKLKQLPAGTTCEILLSDYLIESDFA